MTRVAVIPARYASTRFPGKPLANQTGKFLVQHVYEQAVACARIDRVLVATDDRRIFDAVESFGGSVCMTRSDHPSGTDRVAEAAAALSLKDDDLVINLQGDEPEMDPAVLEQLVVRMEAEGQPPSIGTLAAPFDDSDPREGVGSPADPNCVKIVVDEHDQALYFSRSLVPYPRDTGGVVDRPSRWLLHLGVYAFRAKALRQLAEQTTAQPGRLERAESLEQLRWLADGWKIAVATVSHRAVGIDTPEDYAAFVHRYNAGNTSAIKCS